MGLEWACRHSRWFCGTTKSPTPSLVGCVWSLCAHFTQRKRAAYIDVREHFTSGACCMLSRQYQRHIPCLRRRVRRSLLGMGVVNRFVELVEAPTDRERCFCAVSPAFLCQRLRFCGFFFTGVHDSLTAFSAASACCHAPPHGLYFSHTPHKERALLDGHVD